MAKLRVPLVLSLSFLAVLGGALALARPSDGARRTANVRSAGVDPRSGGFEIVLGEWAVSPEARAIRPGPVTFVIRNRGRFTHGLELKLGRDGSEIESIELAPGGKTTLTLNLSPGMYELECFVGDHDDRGMRAVLEVREDAPLVEPRPKARATVEISGFAFNPATLRTTVGKTVTWRNTDSAPHTATGKQFASPQLRSGASFRHRFSRAGSYTYLCALHPGMRGKVIVGN
ncbi:MAG TPA: hypothetical protein VGQ84_07030 [Gaiellaceae bacterium]|jgi:plastocyanin|nr:hypothetical protein [Gaiellaceae bacterium]